MIPSRVSSSEAESVAASASRTRTPAERFRLAGPSARRDPRVTAARPDLVDRNLAGTIFAAHYAEALPRRVVAVTTAMRGEPDHAAPAVSELNLGEDFALLDERGGWAWGRSPHDGQVGYVRAAALGSPGAVPTHAVTAAAALLFASADIKSPVIARWPMGARFTGSAAGDFLATPAGFVHARHASPLDAGGDPVALAERLVGTPYKWGGRSGDGIDCSGLVQLALGLAGIAALRDSDQQRGLGAEIAGDAPLRRGDIICFTGHIGLMTDDTNLVHANAHWMAVAIEPLAAVVARGAAIVARRRLG